jgi:hypothetical protein
MKRLLASVALVVAAAALSGCYYDPGYSYVRGSSYNGDAYYGQAAPVYEGGYGGYYGGPGYGYYDGYSGYGGYGGGYGGYGCCYGSGVSVGVYSGSHYHHDYDRDDGNYRRGDERGHEGHWQSHPAYQQRDRGRDQGDHAHRGSWHGDRDHDHR